MWIYLLKAFYYIEINSDRKSVCEQNYLWNQLIKKPWSRPFQLQSGILCTSRGCGLGSVIWNSSDPYPVTHSVGSEPDPGLAWTHRFKIPRHTYGFNSIFNENWYDKAIKFSLILFFSILQMNFIIRFSWGSNSDSCFYDSVNF